MADSDGDTQVSFDTVSWNETPATPPVADTPSETGPAAPPPAAATTPPASPPAAGDGVRDDSGPVPFDRHKAILESERAKLADVEAKWKRVEWANELVEQGLTPEQAKQALAIHGHLAGNPAAFFESFLHQAQAHPELAQQVRSIAARVLGAGAGPSGQDDPEPQPDFYTEGADGSRIPFMSAPQMQKWREWHDRAQQRKLDERFGPIEQAEQARAQAAAVAQYRDQVTSEVKAELTALRQQPHFKEHEADVRTYMESQQWRVSLTQAWLHVLQTKVLPTLSQTARDAAIADMQKRAHASSVNPKGGAPSTPASPKGFDDPSLKWT
jgi:hypothetical protein